MSALSATDLKKGFVYKFDGRMHRHLALIMPTSHQKRTITILCLFLFKKSSRRRWKTKQKIIRWPPMWKSTPFFRAFSSETIPRGAWGRPSRSSQRDPRNRAFLPHSFHSWLSFLRRIWAGWRRVPKIGIRFCFRIWKGSRPRCTWSLSLRSARPARSRQCPEEGWWTIPGRPIEKIAF